LPLLVFVFVQFISLPVDRDYGVICRVGDRRHLKGKDVVFKFVVSFADGISFSVVKESLIGELTIETSDNQDLGIANLTNATTLPCRKKSLTSNHKRLPFFALGCNEIVWYNFETLNTIEILFSVI
jgi:hypothetical protein